MKFREISISVKFQVVNPTMSTPGYNLQVSIHSVSQRSSRKVSPTLPTP